MSRDWGYSMTPILGPHTVPAYRAARYLRNGPNLAYTDTYRSFIARLYFDVCDLVGLDVAGVLAQVGHETTDPKLSPTGPLTSWWSQPPRHNPAGLGVTGAKNSDGSPVGLSFENWELAVVAHCGRLLAYARTDAELNQVQRMLVREALSMRSLPEQLRGQVQNWEEFGGPLVVGGQMFYKWAVDPNYPAGITRHLAAIRSAE